MKPRHTSNGSSEEIQANIAHTRAQMDETLDALSERLQPRHILDDLLDYLRFRGGGSARSGARRAKRAAGRAAAQVKQSASGAGRAAAGQVRQHPIPALLIGAGISWLLMERYREDDYEDYDVADEYGESVEGEYNQLEPGAVPEKYALPQHYSAEHDTSGTMEKIKEKGAHLKDKAEAGLHRLKERTARKSEALRQKASARGTELKHQAQHTYEHGVETFKRTADEHPLTVGLGFLALGVVAGMLLPSTRKEDELVGPTRDRLLERSRETAEEAISRGKYVAEAAAEAAKSEASSQGLTPEALKEKAQAVVTEVKETVREEVTHQQEEMNQS